MRASFTTPKGTVLPLLNLKGKEYLNVQSRLIWFREECPKYRIETDIVRLGDSFCVTKATIKDDEGNIISTAHKHESKQGFDDYIEKSETGAIGRALANCGYGTQFTADDLNEIPRVVDSPVEASPRAQASNHAPVKANPVTPKRNERATNTDPAKSIVAHNLVNEFVKNMVNTSQPVEPAFDKDEPWPKIEDFNFDSEKASNPATDYFEPQMAQHAYETYKISFGMHKGKTIHDLGIGTAKTYLNILKDKSNKSGEKPSGNVIELENMIREYEKFEPPF